MVDSVNCKKCKECMGKECQVWLTWFKQKWAKITTWYKGKPIVGGKIIDD